MIFRKKVLFVYVIFCFIINIAGAVTTSVWEQSTYKDFSSGKPKNISLTSKNEMILSRSLHKIEGSIPESRIWCIIQDSMGNIYAGTGDNGRIYKITKEGQISLLFDSPETDIVSLAIDNNDNLFAGSSPDGIIYKISPGRVPETFFKSEEKYIWSLVLDKSGNLYAGTGIAGKLFKISPDGKGEVFYDSNETHIKSLLYLNDVIYAGSESNGIIYKISLDGKVFVIYDTDEREISCLTADAQGKIYASAVIGEAGPQQRDSAEQGGQPPSNRGRKEERRALIYEITPDHVVRKIWDSPDPIIFSIIVDGEDLIVGTGNEGNIYSIKPNGDWAYLADCEESQVISLYKTPKDGELWLATGNPAKLYKLSLSYVKEGTFESNKNDVSITSKWGNISWDAILPEGTNITISTRTGNTDKPDSTWSEWSEEYNDSSGTQIKSPPARFIQWRAKLTSTDGKSTPILRRVSIPYLQRNLSPEVVTIDIVAEQERSEGPPRMPTQSRMQDADQELQMTKSPLNEKRTIKWQAKDPNNDQLQYSIYFRGIEEQSWKLLKDEVKTTSYPLDTESFPDGKYLIKVIASDLPGNPKDLALSGELISEVFTIDNTPPKVFDLQTTPVGNNAYLVTGKIEDQGSYIKNIFYSIDGSDWKTILPSDQILDSKIEYLSFQIETLLPGEHTIAIKSTDAAGNVGSAKTVIYIK